MISHTYSPCDDIVVLVVTRLQDGIFYFLQNDPGLPGVHFVNEALTPITEQIVKNTLKTLKDQGIADTNSLSFELSPHYCDEVMTQAQGKAALYFCVLNAKACKIDATDWVSFPKLLTQMPPNKNRIAYIKAFQVLSGAHQEKLKAVELESQ